MLIFLTTAMTITSNQNGSKRVPKATNMEPKGCQNEPRDVPKHSLRNRVEKVRRGGGLHPLSFGAVLDQTSIKIQSQKQLKIVRQKT